MLASTSRSTASSTRAGSVVERVTEFLGLISPAFCISSALSWGNLADELDALLLAIIEADLHFPPDPPALSASDARQVRFAQILLDECFVNDTQRDTDMAADVQRRGIEQRQAHAKELLESSRGLGADRWCMSVGADAAPGAGRTLSRRPSLY